MVTTHSTLDLDAAEEPGTGLPVLLCAYCSRSYPEYNEEMELVELPRTCRRCHAPMDYEEVHKEGGYADQQAEAATKAPPRRGRDRMVRRGNTKGMTRKDKDESE